MGRRLKHLAEAALFIGALGVFRALPLDAASALGGAIGRALGPRLKQTRHARRNLEIAFPEKSAAERAAILRGMWAHLGRVLAEFAHLPGNGLYSRMSCKGLTHLPPPGKAVIFISGHFGQWELGYPIAHEHGVPVALVYRHANNPIIDRRIARLRAAHSANMFPKGIRGAAKMANALRRGESLAILVDQKMNEGVPIPFFGRDAMTAPAFAQLALRYDMPILPARVVRAQGAHFEATLYPPLEITRTGDEAADVRAVLTAVNRLLESWIREHPEQWFWIHRRFGKEVYAEAKAA